MRLHTLHSEVKVDEKALSVKHFEEGNWVCEIIAGNDQLKATENVDFARIKKKQRLVLKFKLLCPLAIKRPEN